MMEFTVLHQAQRQSKANLAVETEKIAQSGINFIWNGEGHKLPK